MRDFAALWLVRFDYWVLYRALGIKLPAGVFMPLLRFVAGVSRQGPGGTPK